MEVTVRNKLLSLAAAPPGQARRRRCISADRGSQPIAQLPRSNTARGPELAAALAEGCPALRAGGGKPVAGGRDSGQAQSAWTAAPHSWQRNGRGWATGRQMA